MFLDLYLFKAIFRKDKKQKIQNKALKILQRVKLLSLNPFKHQIFTHKQTIIRLKLLSTNSIYIAKTMKKMFVSNAILVII